jgi:hypothetical protein
MEAFVEKDKESAAILWAGAHFLEFGTNPIFTRGFLVLHGRDGTIKFDGGERVIEVQVGRLIGVGMWKEWPHILSYCGCTLVE